MTYEGGRPSKKLVPSLSEERSCEHTYSDEGGMTLEVECVGCSGGQSIDNAKCASGIVNILASGVRPDSIVLKGHIHVRYRGQAVGLLCESASALAAVRRLAARGTDASDAKCRTCPASRHRLAPDVVRFIRAEPVLFGARREALSENLTQRLARVGCKKVRECVTQVVWAGCPRRGGA